MQALGPMWYVTLQTLAQGSSLTPHPTLQSDDQANLYGPTDSGTDTDSTISWYTSNGVPASKIAMGASDVH